MKIANKDECRYRGDDCKCVDTNRSKAYGSWKHFCTAFDVYIPMYPNRLRICKKRFPKGVELRGVE